MLRGDIKGGQQFKKRKEDNKLYSELFNEFYLKLEIAGRSKYTLKSYKHHSKYFIDYLGGDISCSKINQETINNYILYMKNVKKITNSNTINSYLQNISPVLKYGIKQHYIEDLQILYLRVQETFKEIYTTEELQRLLEKPKGRSKHSEFVEIRTWAIIWTFASTGVRSRELRHLKIKAVDLMNRTIAVNVTKNKKPRYLPISQSLANVLIEYLKLRGGSGEDYVFPSVYNEIISRSNLQKQVKLYCNAREVYKTSLHLFRHTFITNAVNKNVSPLILKNITGHSSMKELNRYYNAKTSDMVDVINEIAPKINKKESYFKTTQVKK